LDGQPGYEQQLLGRPAPVAAGLAYCTSSAGMVLLNKLALSNFAFRSITMLLLFQCVFSAVAVWISAQLGLIKIEVMPAVLGSCILRTEQAVRCTHYMPVDVQPTLHKYRWT
jgi:hypothetical protein